MSTTIFSTKYWNVILSDDQSYIGRLVIVSLADRMALPDITHEEQSDFFDLIQRLEDIYKKEFSATMFNYSCLMNHAYRDGEAPHVHWHFRPRFAAPVMIAGIEFHDPNFGNHYIPSALGVHDRSTPEVRTYIIDTLRKNFTSD